MKKLIKNGLIYDGSGSSPYRSNILIEKDRIVDITSLHDIVCDLVIDAEGRVITPGFIDSHRHCDIAVITNEDFGDIELAQGITTALSGNCGLTPFPTVDRYRQQLYDFIEPCLGRAPDGMAFDGFQDYMDRLNKSDPYINIGAMIGTGAVKIAAKGFENTPFTQQEMDRAKGYLIDAMEAGAFGVSMGIMYVPECYSSEEEFIDLLKPLAKYDAILTCHIRGEGDSLVESVEEVLRIGRKAGIAVNISHFKSVGLKNWNLSIHRAIDRIEKARAAGQDVSVDFYPYTGGSTTLMTLIPPNVLEPELDNTLAVLSGPNGLDKLKTQIYRQHEGWDNMVLSIGWDRIIISSVSKEENKQFQGTNIRDVSERLGYEDPAELVRDLLVDERGKVGIILMSMAQEDVDTIAKLPYSMVISDSLYSGTESPHPRLYGSFPKIIREYVMERNILSLETAVSKMTYMPAKRYKIKDRGLLKPGYYADINIFRPDQLYDKATYENPRQLSTGMEWVLINGEIAWENDRRSTTRGARILKCW